MNLETINKWLDEEYGCSYTKLEELHNFYFEKYCDLKQENKILKENAENNDKVIDKVNWENMLLKKNNIQLKERIEYLERSNNRREDTILEQRQKISDLEDNWIKLKKYIKTEIPEDVFIDTEWFVSILDKMQELKKKYENAVADYETTMSELQELKKQVEEYQQELEKADSITQSCIFNGKKESKISYRKCLNILDKKETQQKEFIEWLEAMSKMYENEYKDIDIAGHYNCVLAKYKEIIGDDK